MQHCSTSGLWAQRDLELLHHVTTIRPLCCSAKIALKWRHDCSYWVVWNHKCQWGQKRHFHHVTAKSCPNENLLFCKVILFVFLLWCRQMRSSCSEMDSGVWGTTSQTTTRSSTRWTHWSRASCRSWTDCMCCTHAGYATSCRTHLNRQGPDDL